ncbi:MAG: hypothetical protein KBD64_08130 [Gammaproteobacteria bacterium]|nr:hypothetical protein [Gammaproteobacteria bacterium]
MKFFISFLILLCHFASQPAFAFVSKSTAPAVSSSVTGCVGGTGNGILDPGEQCDLGVKNNDDPAISGCKTDCTVQPTGWSCTNTPDGFSKEISITDNPRSLISLYTVLTGKEIDILDPTNTVYNGDPNRISSATAAVKCTATYDYKAKNEDPALIKAVCAQYAQDVQKLIDLNNTVSIQTAAEPSKTDVTQCPTSKIFNTDLTTRVDLHCAPDPTSGVL